tara:strand:+ start:2005 stop:3063 length:1059 start_codon:yes stop_codon:yes gene_type:complete
MKLDAVYHLLLNHLEKKKISCDKEFIDRIQNTIKVQKNKNEFIIIYDIQKQRKEIKIPISDFLFYKRGDTNIKSIENYSAENQHNKILNKIFDSKDFPSIQKIKKDHNSQSKLQIFLTFFYILVMFFLNKPSIGFLYSISFLINIYIFNLVLNKKHFLELYLYNLILYSFFWIVGFEPYLLIILNIFVYLIINFNKNYIFIFFTFLFLLFFSLINYIICAVFIFSAIISWIFIKNTKINLKNFTKFILSFIFAFTIFYFLKNYGIIKNPITEFNFKFTINLVSIISIILLGFYIVYYNFFYGVKKNMFEIFNYILLINFLFLTIFLQTEEVLQITIYFISINSINAINESFN